jgi:hypothetical protein
MLQPKGKLIVRKVLVVLLAMFFVFVSISAVLISVFRQDIIDMAWKRLKASVVTECDAQSIELSFWSSFPMVSIELHDFWIQDAYRRDTLFYADRTYLSFDIWDAWNGNYEVNKMIVRDGIIDLKEDDRLGKNWMVMDTALSSSDSLPISLRKLILEDVWFNYKNDKGLDQSIRIETGKLKGDFNAEQIELEVDITGKAKKVVIEQREWLTQQTIGLNGRINYDKKKEVLQFNNTNFDLAKSTLHLNGWVDFNAGKFDASLLSEKLNATDLLSSMPSFISHWIQRYEPNGWLSFKSTGSGWFSNPKVVADIIWKQGNVVEPDSQLSMEDIDLKITYSLKDHFDEIHLQALSANLGGGRCTVSGDLRDLRDPELDLHVDIQAEIHDLKEYLRWDTLEVAEGKIQLQADVVGKTSVLADSTVDWTKVNAQGGVIITEGNFKLKNSSVQVKDVYAVMQLFQQSAQVQQLNANIGETHFELTGELQNLIPYLTRDDQVLYTNVAIRSSHFNLEDILLPSSSDAVSLFLPRLHWNAEGSIADFHFKEVNATDIQFKANGSPSQMSMEEVSMQLAKGICSGSFQLNQDIDRHWLAHANFNFVEMDARLLFDQFNNFGQGVVKDDQINGKINTQIELNFALDEQWVLDRPSIQFVADVELNDGAIKNLKWLQDVAEYVKKNRWISPVIDEDLLAQRLSNVQFTKLKNIISLSDEVLEIPWMEINTSAFNMVMRATHHFNVELSYLFGIQVSDLLLRDPSQKPKEDGKKMYILMKGPPDALVFSVEREPEDFVFNANAEEQKIKWKERLKSKWIKVKTKVDQGSTTPHSKDRRRSKKKKA